MSVRRLAAIGLIVVPLFVLEFCIAISLLTARKAPEFAIRVWPFSAKAHASLADAAALRGDDQISVVEANRTLDRQALTPQAVRNLAESLEKRTPKLAGRLYALGGRLSRRDLDTQIALINAAAAAGDAKLALQHYDAALRTDRDSLPLLVPTLNTALDQPKIAAAAEPLLHSRPPWLRDFLLSAAYSPGMSLAVAEIASRLPPNPGRGPSGDGLDDARSAILARLAARGDADQIRAFGRSIGAAPAGPEQEMLSGGTRWPPLAWAVSSRADAEVTPLVANDRVELAVDAPTSPAPGPLATRLVALPAGSYTTMVTSTGGEDAPLLTLTCIDGRSVIRRPFQTFMRFPTVVPRGCRMQWLSLVSGPAGAALTDWRATSIRFVRAGR